MKMKRFKVLLKGQRGFTLAELVIAMTIGSLVVTAAVAIMAQMLWVVPRNTSYAAAFTQVQNAATWINRDALMSHEVVVDDDPETTDFELLTLNWTVGRLDVADDVTFEEHRAVYTLVGQSGELGEQKELWRFHYLILAVGDPVLQNTTRVAECIDDANTHSIWYDDSKELVVTVTAQVGEKAANRTYRISPRPLYLPIVGGS